MTKLIRVTESSTERPIDININFIGLIEEETEEIDDNEESYETVITTLNGKRIYVMEDQNDILDKINTLVN